MKKNKVWIGLLIITICLFLSGMAFKRRAEDYQGIQATFGISVNGEFKQTDSGRLASNPEQYEKFNTRGTIFYIAGGITGVMTVIAYVKKRK